MMNSVYADKLNKLPKCLRDVMTGRLVKHDCSDPDNQVVHDMLDKAINTYQLKKEKSKRRNKTIVAEAPTQPVVIENSMIENNMTLVAEPKQTLEAEPTVAEPTTVAELTVEAEPVFSSSLEKNKVEHPEPLVDYCSTLFRGLQPSGPDTENQPEPPRLLRLFLQQKP